MNNGTRSFYLLADFTREKSSQFLFHNFTKISLSLNVCRVLLNIHRLDGIPGKVLTINLVSHFLRRESLQVAERKMARGREWKTCT